MAQHSQNGWPVLTSPPPAVLIPGTAVRVRVRGGDVATVLVEVARRFNVEVEPLALPGPADEWGWARRNVRGSDTVISNHASGTAIDLNATRHPRGIHGTFTKHQVLAIRKILTDMNDAVSWGGDFSTVVDSMHFEVTSDSLTVGRCAARIRAAQKPQPDNKPTPTQEDDVKAELVVPTTNRPGNETMLCISPAATLIVEDPVHEAELRALGATGPKHIPDATYDRLLKRALGPAPSPANN